MTTEIDKQDIDTDKQLEQLKSAFIESEKLRMKNNRIVPQWDKKTGQMYETRPGYRHNGPKKTRLINLVNQQLLQLAQKGVNGETLLKVLGITGDVFTYTTKQWIGVLSKVKQFRKENNV
jgi:hypothetical protein